MAHHEDMSGPPSEAWDDPFHPPSVPTLVQCLHCGEEYDSFLIEYRPLKPTDGAMSTDPAGMWHCPTEGCDGVGFGFDIWPVDEDYLDPDGRGVTGIFDDEDLDEEEEEEEEEEEHLDALEPGPDESLFGEGWAKEWGDDVFVIEPFTDDPAGDPAGDRAEDKAEDKDDKGDARDAPL